MKKECLICKKIFNTKPCFVKKGDGKFCSRFCYGKYLSTSGIKKTEKHKRILLEAAKLAWAKNKGRKLSEEHKKKLSEIMKGRYIPEEWRKKYSQARLKRKKRFGYINSPETRKKISEAKIGKMKGEKHWNWQGGITSVNTKIRRSLEYKKWRMAVLIRDNFACQFCRIRGVYLIAHHIKSFAKYSELRFDINNGVTLCENCHSLTDNYKSKAKGE